MGTMVTLLEMAAAKKLPEQFLASLGVSNTEHGLRIEYLLADNSLAPRQRLRIALKSKDGFRWTKGDGDIVPYGLWRPYVQNKFLFLVEGESDCWTLWYHGLPALGLPGSSTAKMLKAEYLDRFELLYLWQEPEKGGEIFISSIMRQLYEIGWKGKVLVVKSAEYKDPSAIHIANPKEFRNILRAIVRDGKEPERYKPTIKKTIEKSTTKGSLTKEMIERAAGVPMESLMETKAGYILCPYHKDKNPSMWVKGFGYCFVCGKSMNSIQWLRETQNMTFVDAVKTLLKQ